MSETNAVRILSFLLGCAMYPMSLLLWARSFFRNTGGERLLFILVAVLVVNVSLYLLAQLFSLPGSWLLAIF